MLVMSKLLVVSLNYLFQTPNRSQMVLGLDDDELKLSLFVAFIW